MTSSRHGPHYNVEHNVQYAKAIRRDAKLTLMECQAWAKAFGDHYTSNLWWKG